LNYEDLFFTAFYKNARDEIKDAFIL